jgi:hypothetical protein
VPSNYGKLLIRHPTISSIKNDLRKTQKITVARIRTAEKTPEIREDTGLMQELQNSYELAEKDEALKIRCRLQTPNI